MGDGVYKRFRLICDRFRVSSPRVFGNSMILSFLASVFVFFLAIEASSNERREGKNFERRMSRGKFMIFHEM